MFSKKKTVHIKLGSEKLLVEAQAEQETVHSAVLLDLKRALFL